MRLSLKLAVLRLTKNDCRRSKKITTIYEDSLSCMLSVILHQNYSTGSGGDESGDVTNKYPNKFSFTVSSLGSTNVLGFVLFLQKQCNEIQITCEFSTWLLHRRGVVSFEKRRHVAMHHRSTMRLKYLLVLTARSWTSDM